MFRSILFLLVSAVFSSGASAMTEVPPPGMGCGGMIAAWEAKQYEEALRIVGTLGPEEKERAKHYFTNLRRLAPYDVIGRITDALQHPDIASAYLDLQTQLPLYVATVDERDADVDARSEILAKYVGDDYELHRNVAFSHSGARALAFLSVGKNDLFEANFAKWLELQHRDRGEAPYGLDDAGLRAIFEATAKDPDLQARNGALDALYQLLFEASPALYNDWAHDPFLLPYVYFVHLGEHDDRGMGEEAASILDLIAPQVGARPRAELDAHFTSILADGNWGNALRARLSPRRVPSTERKLPPEHEVLEKLYGAHLPAKKQPQELFFTRLKELAQQYIAVLPGLESWSDPMRLLQSDLAYAFQAILRGTSNATDKAFARAFSTTFLFFETAEKVALRAAVEKMAADPAIRKHFVDTIVGQVSIETQLFTGMLYDDGLTMPSAIAGDDDLSVLDFRPAQVEFARAVFQYGNLTPKKSKLLEVGYRSLATPALFNRFLGGNVTGLEVGLAPHKPRMIEGEGDLLLVQGNAPLEPTPSAQVAARGPYDVVAAVDVWKKDITVGAPFAPGVENARYLEWLYGLLNEGGVVIAMNDYGEHMPFTAQEIRAAGFTIEVWNEIRSIPQEVAQRYLATAPNLLFGHLNLVVLRRGVLPPEPETP